MRRIIGCTILLLLFASHGQAAPYAGRLTIPEAGISVALYGANDQGIVDAEDSAAAFHWQDKDALVIADHKHQAFGNLKRVQIGMTAQITQPDGRTVRLVCVAAYDGTNTGYSITDGNGRVVIGDNDVIMYTCLRSWRDVRVCQWEEYGL